MIACTGVNVFGYPVRWRILISWEAMLYKTNASFLSIIRYSPFTRNRSGHPIGNLQQVVWSKNPQSHIHASPISRCILWYHKHEKQAIIEYGKNFIWKELIWKPYYLKNLMAHFKRYNYVIIITLPEFAVEKTDPMNSIKGYFMKTRMHPNVWMMNRGAKYLGPGISGVNIKGIELAQWLNFLQISFYIRQS